MRDYLMIILFLGTLGACAHPHSMLGISEGSGANITIIGPTSERLFDVSKAVIEENGCTVTRETRNENPAVIYGSGSQAENSKVEITELSPTSNRVLFWNSQKGVFTDSQEKSFVNTIFWLITRRARGL